MQKVIDQITDHLVSLVTTDKEFYNPKDLLKSGIPSFVVERVRLLLEDKVIEEIGEFETQWFNSDARLVDDAYNDYIRSALSNSHIPKEYLYEILNTVIRDIIYVFIKPRKNMAEYIFRDVDELSFEEVEERCARLTIYRHFGVAIPLYMKKRNLELLSKERCKVLIHKLDAKLVASYTAEDWAQKLEQLFTLFGGKVNPLLLATFFEDKGLYGMAGKFESEEESLTKKDFISIISAEDIAALIPETDSENIKEEKSEQETPEKEKMEQKLVENFFGNYKTEEEKGEDTLADQFSDGGLSDDEMSELLSDIASDGIVEVDNFEQVGSLNKVFSINLEDDDENNISETTEEIAAKIKLQSDEEEVDITEFRENLVSILDQAKNSFENIDKKDNPDDIVVDEDLSEVFEEERSEEPESENEDIFQEEGNSEEEKSDKKPIWAQFINEDQMDVLLGGDRNKSSEDHQIHSKSEDEDKDEIEVDDIYSENPFIEDSSDDVFTQKDVLLEQILEDRELEFIDTIFKGSKKKFEKAIDKIENFEEWKEASKFIQKDVFLKNDVDMFAGATVDFTDRVHQYFNEKEQ